MRGCVLSVGISHFAIPCWHVTWAQIEKFLFGISSRRQKVPGSKDETYSGFAIPLDAPIHALRQPLAEM